MTNADKYLKDGVDVEELANILKEYGEKYPRRYYNEDFIEFMNLEVKPTLTVDEKVILRNIDEMYITIGRYEDGILEFNRIDGHYSNSCYPLNHLFQFIKPRRRI